MQIGGEMLPGASGYADGDPPVEYSDTSALTEAEIHAVILPLGEATLDDNGQVRDNAWAFMPSDPIDAFTKGLGWRALFRSAPSE